MNFKTSKEMTTSILCAAGLVSLNQFVEYLNKFYISVLWKTLNMDTPFPVVIFKEDFVRSANCIKSPQNIYVDLLDAAQNCLTWFIYHRLLEVTVWFCNDVWFIYESAYWWHHILSPFRSQKKTCSFLLTVLIISYLRARFGFCHEKTMTMKHI